MAGTVSPENKQNLHMSRDLSVPLPVKHPLTHRTQVQVDLDVERVRHPSPLKGSGEEVVRE